MILLEETMADFGGEMESSRAQVRDGLDEAFAAEALAAVRAWLRSKANAIEGGASQIDLNVVAKRVLGLPDPLKSS